MLLTRDPVASLADGKHGGQHGAAAGRLLLRRGRGKLHVWTWPPDEAASGTANGDDMRLQLKTAPARDCPSVALRLELKTAPAHGCPEVALRLEIKTAPAHSCTAVALCGSNSRLRQRTGGGAATRT